MLSLVSARPSPAVLLALHWTTTSWRSRLTLSSRSRPLDSPSTTRPPSRHSKWLTEGKASILQRKVKVSPSFSPPNTNSFIRGRNFRRMVAEEEEETSSEEREAAPLDAVQVTFKFKLSKFCQDFFFRSPAIGRQILRESTLGLILSGRASLSHQACETSAHYM